MKAHAIPDLTPDEITRFWTKVTILTKEECWLWTAGTSCGYAQFSIRNRPTRASRVAWKIATGRNAEGLGLCHKCDNPLCVNPEHLFEGTQKMNMADCKIKGRNPFGEAVGNAKLSETDVLEIQALSFYGATQRDICAAYNIGRKQIYRIKNGLTWPSVLALTT